MLEIINKKIDKLKKERNMVNGDYCALLQTLEKHNEAFKMEHGTINIIMNYSYELTIIDEKIKLLEELKREAQ